MSKITHLNRPGTLKTFSDLRTKVWPNGEIVIYRELRKRCKPLERFKEVSEGSMQAFAAIAAHGIGEVLRLLRQPLGWALMGLSPLPNSDKPKKVLPRKGLKGITPLGARRVRNAAYLLQRKFGERRLSFTTVTVPNLPYYEMKVLHENWHKAVELYRLAVRRALDDADLPTGIVGVSEIQEKRQSSCDMPVLHCHFVFVGGWGYGRWALSVGNHDGIWAAAISAVIGRKVGAIKSACNMQSVHSSAEAYLGKYISKGAKTVAGVIDSGQAEWLPRQWWSCSRSLLRWMENEKILLKSGSEYLLDILETTGREIFAFHRTVAVDYSDDFSVPVATFGRLTPLGQSLIMAIARC